MLVLLTTLAIPAQGASDSDREAPEPAAVTTSDPRVPLDELALAVKPLTSEELLIEAKGWMRLLRQKVEELTQAELTVKRKRSESGTSSTTEGKTAESPETSPREPTPQVSATADKGKILETVSDLRDQRTGLIDRMNVVLDEVNAKLGKAPEGKDNEKVVPYRLYAQSVSGIKVDISDTRAATATLLGWLKSDEGGIRWAKNLGVFIVILTAFWVLAGVLSRALDKAFRLARAPSALLRNFFVGAVRRATVIVGLIVGLSALEVNIGPLLAVIGAAGFVVAFALQNTLSNFASGLMIMFYRPFDIGDVVNVAGVIGKVNTMSLVNTTITTGDNQVMVVPNNAIWGGTITNITGSEERRVDLIFGISYGDDIGHAQRILEAIVDDHPLVLKEPEAVIRVGALGESSVNFICRPWVKTADYWTVYWDITREVKERFDREGISIPFPQRDVHIRTKAADVKQDTRGPA